MNSVSTARMRLHGGDRQLGAEQGAQGGSDARLAAAHQLGQMRVQHPARAHRTSPRAVRSSAHLYRAEFRKAERAGAGTAPVPTATQEKSTGLSPQWQMVSNCSHGKKAFSLSLMVRLYHPACQDRYIARRWLQLD